MEHLEIRTVSILIASVLVHMLIAGISAYVLRGSKSRRSAPQAKNHSVKHFLDVTSHNMRAPLQTAMNLVHLIIAEQAHKMDDAGKDDVKTLQHSFVLLEGIMDKAADYSKIEMGEMHFADNANTDILAELHNLLTVVSHGTAAVKAQQCEFSFHVDNSNNSSNNSMMVTVDRARICRAVMNVVGNAIKFTQVGHVKVHVSAELAENTNNNSSKPGIVCLCVTVEDSGPGISPELVPTLFNAYAGAGVKDGGGSGLGMFITKAVVDHYDGKIDVRSEVGKGSTFTLRFKLATTATSTTTAAAATINNNPCPDKLDLMMKVSTLNDKRHKAVARSGSVASAATTPPMSPSSSPTLLTLRRLPSSFSASLSSMGGNYCQTGLFVPPSPAVPCGAEGVKWPNAQEAANTSSFQPRESDGDAAVRVLFAEDEPLNLQTGKRLLESLGAAVRTAADGLQTLKLAEQYYDQIDVFVLDMHMSGMCGDAVARGIRELEARRATSEHKPIIALTGHVEHEMAKQLMACGFTSLVSKPASAATFAELLVASSVA